MRSPRPAARHKWLKGSLAVAALALVAVPAGAASVTNSAARALTVDMNIGPAQLDPANNTGLNDTIVGNFYVRLTTLATKPGPSGTRQVNPKRVRPYLARSWKITKGGTVYTFNLRRGTRFSDGTPVTAAAVKFSFERDLTMGLAGAYFLDDGVPGNIQSIATPNTHTVVIKVKLPDPNLLQAWAAPPAAIVNPRAVQAHGGVQKSKTNAWMASHVAGSGPYILKSYQPNVRMVMVANPRYFGPRPSARQVTVNFIPSEATLLLRAKKAQADVSLGLTPQSLHTLKGTKGIRIISNETTLTEWLGFVDDAPPFNNEKVRAALARSIPYSQIISHVAYGYGTPYFGPFPPAMPFFHKEALPKYDVAKAKQLLQASGVSLPISASIIIQAGNPGDQQIATLLQGLWKQVGVNLTIDQLSPADYINKLLSHKGVQLFLREDGPGVIDPGYYLDYDMRCNISFNLSDICIPAADKLLTTARQTTSVKKRTQLYAEITKLWVAQVPKIPLFAIKAAAVLHSRVKGYVFNQVYPDFSTWTIK